MTPLELLKLATEAFPDLREYYHDDPDLDATDLFASEGTADPLAETIVAALLDSYEELQGQQPLGQPHTVDVLGHAAEKLFDLTNQIAEVRQVLVKRQLREFRKRR